MIVGALTAVGALTLAGAAVPFFMAFVVLRFLAGLLGSCGPTSLMASIGDLFPFERRSRAMAWFNMGVGLAAIAGVPVVGALACRRRRQWAADRHLMRTLIRVERCPRVFSSSRRRGSTTHSSQ